MHTIPPFRSISKQQRSIKAKRLLSCLMVSYVFYLLTFISLTAQATPSKSESSQAANIVAAQAQLAKNYGKLPLHFEANQGQTDSEIKFLARGPGYGLFLTSTAAVMSLRKSESSGGSNTSHPVVSSVSDGLVKDRMPRFGTTKNETQNPEAANVSHPCILDSDTPCRNDEAKNATLRMQLLGANPSSQVTGLEELPGKVNYFQGKDSAQWRTDVPTYAKVKYQAVYPGIDLVYYGNQRQLEYDFIVAPGADPKAIKFGFAGLDETTKFQPRIDDNGDLIVSAEGGEVRWKKPVIYQEKAGQRKMVDGRFAIANSKVGFQVTEYDKTRPLVIDPVLVYSTYLGGNGTDIGRGIAVDKFGNVYVTGQTRSTNFPVKNSTQKKHNGGQYDTFVAKLNKAGSSLAYSTYLGGSKNDFGNDIAVDSQGNAYVTGSTESRDFPTKNPLQKAIAGQAGSDSFVIKLNASGSALVYSTYLGGGFSLDEGHGIAVDKSGNAYVTGVVYVPIFCSSDFPTTKSAFQPVFGCSRDAFVTKLNANGSALVYSTFLGGSASEWGYDIAVDGSGNAYVTGEAFESVDFPTQNPFQKTHHGGIGDAFVTKLNASGSALLYSTYLGGKKRDAGLGIAADALGNAYVTGTTRSTDFPTKYPLQKTHGGGGRGVAYENDDAFITKLNKSGTALIYSTYLGGKDPVNTAFNDGGRGIAVDGQGQAYVTGYTTSDQFPTKNPLQKAKGGPASDAFVTKLNKLGTAFVYSTYLGGTGNNGDVGYAIAVDSLGQAYITGKAGSSAFPAKNSIQKTNKGLDDAFIVKISK